MKEISNAIVIFFVLLCSLVSAQEKELKISVKEAEQYAIDHNKLMANATLEVKRAEADRWQSIASMLPQVSASLDYNNYCGYEMKLMGMSVPMNPVGTIGLTAAVAISGTQIVSTRLTKIATEMAKINTNQNDQTICSQVKQIYISVLVMEKTITLLDSTLLNLDNLYRITNNAVEAGAAEETDADQISIQVSSMRNNINSTKRSLEMLYNSLKLQLGCDINAQLILTDDIDQILDVNAINNLLNASFDINRNYNYQLLEQNMRLAKTQTTLAIMEYIPSLSAYYQLSGKTYFGKDAGMNMTPPNLIGATLSIPIWSSGIRAAKVKSAKLNYQETENTLTHTENALRIQDKQLRYNLISAMEDYNTQKDNIEVSKRVFASITRKYEYGTASSLDLTNASNNLITAQSNYIQSMMTLLSSQIELENLMNN